MAFDLKNILLETMLKSLIKALVREEADKIERVAAGAFTPNRKVHEELCKAARVNDPKIRERLYGGAREAGKAYGAYLGSIIKAGAEE